MSTLSNNAFITPILSDTFFPPKIPTNGLTGLFNASPKIFNSFSIKNPHADGKKLATPAVDECALWHVPNASFTYNSAKLANSFDNSSSFFSSLASNLTFSNKTTSPGFISDDNLFASSPTTSFANLTSNPNCFDNSAATGASENSGFTSPFGLPKCEHKITAALCSNKYLIVSNDATILELSVIFNSESSGTLKSHLTNTFFPFTSKSLTVTLFILLPLILLYCKKAALLEPPFYNYFANSAKYLIVLTI